MRIIKVFCHNAVLVLAGKEEFVVVGKGIGFNKNPGDLITQQAIESIYKQYSGELLD